MSNLERLKKNRELLNSNPSKARSTAKQVLKVEKNDDEIIVEAIEIIGLSYFNENNYDNCIIWLKKIIEQKDRYYDFSSFRKAYQFIGHSIWRKGNRNKPVEYFQKAIDWSLEHKQLTEAAKDQVNLGALYFQAGNYKQSIKFNSMAYKHFFSIDDKTGLGFTLGNLGNCFYSMGNYKKALEFQFKTEKLAREIGDKSLLGRSLNSISICYKNIGIFQKAVDFGLQSIQIKEILNEDTKSIYINIGSIYAEWGNNKKSLEFLQKALSLDKKSNDLFGRSNIFNNIGNLYLSESEYDKALSYFKKAKSLKETIDDLNGMIIVLGNMGIIYSKKDDFEKAESCYKKALEFAIQLEKRESIFSISLNLIDLYCNNDCIEQAEEMFAICKKDFAEIDSYKLRMDYYDSAILLAEKGKDFKKAYRLLSQKSKLRDEIFSQDKQKIISEMQIKFDTVKKEKEAEIYRIKSIELAKKNKKIENQKKELQKALEKLRKSEQKYDIIAQEFHKKIGYDLIGTSESIRKINKLISIVATSDSTNVLIVGESGTGKEIVARRIHQYSARKQFDFYGINSSAIPENLFESQFFGHEKNAFTGANKTHIGWFEIANKGTLFLDEIATMSLEQQVKLLRVLEERKIVRVGSHKEIPVNVRIISATNVNLYEMVQKKQFREDLYHRLATFVIHIPPLREHKEDIPLLLDHFVQLFSEQLKKPIKKIEKDVVNMLYSYDYSGNVRELKNIIERAVIVANSSTLMSSHFLVPDRALSESVTQQFPSLAEVEKKYVLKALQLSEFNQTKAAKLLKVERRVVARKMQKYQIKKPGE